MTSADWIDLIKTVGVGVASLALFLWLLLRGKLHTDSEFQREVTRADAADTKLDRIITIQEQTVELIKQNIEKRAEINSIEDLAKLADYARHQGLIK